MQYVRTVISACKQ